MKSLAQAEAELAVEELCDNAKTTATLVDDVDCRLARITLDHSNFYDNVGSLEQIMKDHCEKPQGQGSN